MSKGGNAVGKEIEKMPAFRWQYLIVYLLIAAFISYGLIDFKLRSEAPTSSTEKRITINVTSDDGSFEVDKQNGDYVEQIEEPGTIGEIVPSSDPEESTSATSVTDSTANTTKKPSTTRRKPWTRHTTDPSEADLSTTDPTDVSETSESTTEEPSGDPGTTEPTEPQSDG